MNYFLSRILGAAVVIFGVVTLVFFLIHLVPGDPVDFMLKDAPQSADRDYLREKLGLNKPLSEQYLAYLKGVVQFDFGTSLYSQAKVSDIILARLPSTAYLALCSILVAILIAFPLGVISAMKRNTHLDRGAMVFSLLGVSIPNFLLGPILILIFSLWLGWLPVSGNEHWSAIILPAIALGTALAAILSRMIRSSLLEVLNEDYIRTARAKGLSYNQVVIKHGLRNALLPVVTLLGLQLGALLGGAVITETVFSWPGIGKLTIDAILARDYPIVQACVLLISLFYVIVNMLTDLIYAWIDPRIRLGEG